MFCFQLQVKLVICMISVEKRLVFSSSVYDDIHIYLLRS